MSWILNTIYGLLVVLLAPFWAWRVWRTPGYGAVLRQRLRGSSPRIPKGKATVWMHAVSVGEVVLLKPLIDRLIRKLPPGHEIVLSVTTMTGMAVAREKFPNLRIFYSPLDFSWSLKRVFQRVRPRLIVLAEAEIWPNWLIIAKARQIPVLVINARMSDRSFKGYRRLRWLLSGPLAAIRWWGAQTEEYANRIRQLPLAEASVVVTGSMKYDGAPTERRNPKTSKLRDLLGYTEADRILLAGSIQPAEERLVLTAYKQLLMRFPDLKLIVVPRHPERFDPLAATLAEQGWEFIRRSTVNLPRTAAAPVTLLDSVGELGIAWGLATVGYVGGSYQSGRGGQSMIEPAGYGVPVCFGPETWNFRETVHRLVERDAACVIRDEASLVDTVAHWLENPTQAEEAGARARRFILSQQGAVDRTLLAITDLLHQGVPKRHSA